MNPTHDPTKIWVLITSLALATPVFAAQPISILNPGFEDPVLDDGSLQANAPGWSPFNGGDVDVLNPAQSDLTAEAPEGANVVVVTGTTVENGLAQTLGSPFQPDAAYTLSAKVGNTRFTSGFPGYRVQLVANGTVLAEDDNSLTIAEDSVATSTVNYTYNAALHAALVGQPLQIRLLSKGLVAGQEVAFDDIKLTVTLANPLAVTGGPYKVDIPAGSLTLNGSGSLPSDGQTLTAWEWDLDNDGDFDEAVTGPTPAVIDYATLTAAPPTGFGMVAGVNTIKLKVTDNSSPTPKTSIAETSVTLAEPGTTMTASSNWNGGTWNNGQPTVGLDAVIAAGITATATNGVTPWSGKLTLEPGATLVIRATANPNPAGMVFEGATQFILGDGSKIIDNFKTATFAQNFVVSGTAGMDSTSNDGNNHNRTFTGTISGGTWVTDGRNHQGYTYNSPNTFTGYLVRSTEAQRHGVRFNAAGAAGLGNVTVSSGGAQSAVLILGADNVFAESCVLTLNGQGWANSTGGFGPYASGAWVGTSMRIFMSTFNATVSQLWIDGVQQAAGAYTGGSGNWIGGTGTLTVLNGPNDNTAPTLAGSDIVDDKSGGPVTAFETVTYTVTFSEPIRAATVGIDDFENAATPPATIQSVAPTANPAVFTVAVTPGGPGTLRLQVKAGAVIEDLVGNPLVTTSAIPDDTVLTVEPDPPPSLVSIVDNQGGGPVLENQVFTYLVTFDQAMNPATVEPSDFENGEATGITVTNVMATGNPAVFAVDVTPGGAGSITLRIKAGAVLTNANGTALNTAAALPDDGSVVVNAGMVPARGTITVDGAISWSANSATLTNTLDASGSDKLVVIVTGENGNPGSLAGNCTGVTYDGVPLIQAVDRAPIGSTPVDQTFQDIWYLDLAGVTTVSGTIVANVSSRGSVTAFALSGTAPGVGSTVISPQGGKSVVVSTTSANSIVIAAHGMGGDGNSANVTAVDLVPPLIGRRASAQASGAPSPWDGHVTAYALVSNAGSASYGFTGGNVIGSHTIAAEFPAALASTGSGYEAWIAGFPGVGGLTAVGDDADGDGVDNGAENFFGTDPGVFSRGLVATGVSGNTFTFTHPRNASPASDLTAVYQWSKDLATFHDDGAGDGGTTVTFTTQADAPAPGFTTVTATVTGTPVTRLFVNLKVTRN